MPDPNDFESLLDLTVDDEGIFSDLLQPDEGPAPAEEDEEDARIRMLEEALAKPMPEAVPEPVVEKTAKQLRIEELEDQLARRKAAELENAPVRYSKASGDGERILIHVVEDGFTALGTTWYRGQMMEFVKPSRDYSRTKDIHGFSWVDIAGDIEAQYKRWGKQYLGLGKFIPRPGEKFDDEIAAEDARRGYAIPVVLS